MSDYWAMNHCVWRGRRQERHDGDESGWVIGDMRWGTVEEIEEKDKHSAESRVPELESCCFSSGEQLLQHVEACYHYQSDNRGRALAALVTSRWYERALVMKTVTYRPGLSLCSVSIRPLTQLQYCHCWQGQKDKIWRVIIIHLHFWLQI